MTPSSARSLLSQKPHRMAEAKQIVADVAEPSLDLTQSNGTTLRLCVSESDERHIN
jgi:hypothetical protein